MNPAILLLSASVATAAEPAAYLAWNPLAPLSAIPSKPMKIAGPLVADMESGLALAGGLVLRDRHILEARISLGSPHSLTWSFLPQARIGASWFLRRPRADRSPGPYAGADLRLWDLIYWTTGYGNWSLLPAVHLGWWFERDPWFAKVRVEQVLGACSWSTQPHTSGACDVFLSPAEEMMPVLPLLGVDVGRRL